MRPEVLSLFMKGDEEIKELREYDLLSKFVYDILTKYTEDEYVLKSIRDIFKGSITVDKKTQAMCTVEGLDPVLANAMYSRNALGIKTVLKAGKNNRFIKKLIDAQLNGYEYYIFPVKGFGKWVAYIGRSAPEGSMRPYIAIPADGISLYTQALECYFKKEDN
jgi:hypothetical protein